MTKKEQKRQYDMLSNIIREGMRRVAAAMNDPEYAQYEESLQIAEATYKRAKASLAYTRRHTQ